jgi:hypothetical protein
MNKTQNVKESLGSLSHVSNLHVKFNRKIPDCCYLFCIYTLENTEDLKGTSIKQITVYATVKPALKGTSI